MPQGPAYRPDPHTTLRRPHQRPWANRCLCVDRTQEACREEVGEGRTQLAAGATFKDLDSEGPGELLRGLKQEGEETRLPLRCTSLPTERRRAWTK